MLCFIVPLALASLTSAFVVGKKEPTAVPPYFWVTPEIFNGPTSSGVAPFLAETNPVPNFGMGLGGASATTFIPNSPLETAIPIRGNTNNSNIFQLMGSLSPYSPNPSGFGIQEMPLPPGANITWLNMVSRHGSRYPTINSSQQAFGTRIAAAQKAGAKFTGVLGFLNTWSNRLGYEVLVPVGKQELFDSGVLHYYDYGHLYNTSTTIVARTTTQEGMRQSAEYFLAGFFGLDWQNYAKLEFIIEQSGFNDSLVGFFGCHRSSEAPSSTGSTAANEWVATYLQNATASFGALVSGYNWTVTDSYAMQGMCPYETVGLGYSDFCNLFTFQEWQSYEYSIDVAYAGNNMFQSPTGRAVGIGYVQEVLGRLNHRYVTAADTSNNVTLDSMSSTFPLNQSLYFDFSHDTNIASILAAFNFTQFQPLLSAASYNPDRQLIVSQMTPFASRLDIEVIDSPRPVCASRTNSTDAYAAGSTDKPTQYIHFILNQRTLPLYPGYPECGDRTDGWCDLSTFLKKASGLLAAAKYGYSCNGNYSAVPYGQISEGVPIS